MHTHNLGNSDKVALNTHGFCDVMSYYVIRSTI